jgi:hypothetical protein
MSDECFKLYDVNLVEQSTITPSTVNAQFPASNLKDYRRSKVYRSITNSDNLILDFQESSEINGIFIVADKKAGFGVSTLTVDFNATSNFTTPAFTASVPFSPELGIGHLSLATTIAYRFARVRMTSTLGYCELSKLFIGKAVPLERSINFGWTIKDEDLSIKTRNRYGQIFADIITRQKNIGFAIRNANKEDVQLINKVLDRVGETKPLYLAIGNDLMATDYRRFSGPVILEDIPTITNASFNRFNMSFSVRELT